jgi:sensor histidine kinase YesM
MVQQLFSKWWFRHTLFWIFMLLYLAWGVGFIKERGTSPLIVSCSLAAGSMFVVYPVLYYLIPKYLVNRKFLSFFLGYAVLIAIAAVIRIYIQRVTGLPVVFSGFASKIGNNILPYTNICAIAVSFKLLRHAFIQQQKAEKAVQEKVETELELLKTQIHPRFLFNTLNSLYSHARQNSSNAPRIILTLSDLLRFMIYESNAEFIPLTQEIQLIKNYVELEKFRYGDEIEISMTFSGDLEGKLIRPLLLLPLLENCFKYGTDDRLDQKWISLDLNIAGNNMHFKLANSRNPESRIGEIDDKTTGMSLGNVKRMIELYYPGEHNILIKEDEDIFLVKLELTLKPDVTDTQKIDKTENIEYDLEMPPGG